jgi:hypothetical protein
VESLLTAYRMMLCPAGMLGSRFLTALKLGWSCEPPSNWIAFALTLVMFGVIEVASTAGSPRVGAMVE